MFTFFVLACLAQVCLVFFCLTLANLTRLLFNEVRPIEVFSQGTHKGGGVGFAGDGNSHVLSSPPPTFYLLSYSL